MYVCAGFRRVLLPSGTHWVTFPLLSLPARAPRQVLLLERLEHPNVVKYYESFVEGNVLHIVMQYCSGGDLAHVIKACAKAKQKLDEEVCDACPFCRAAVLP